MSLERPQISKSLYRIGLLMAIIGGLIFLISIIAPIIGLGNSKAFFLYNVIAWTRTDLGYAGIATLALALCMININKIKLFYTSNVKNELDAKNILLLFFSITLSIIAIEGIYRAYLYHNIKSTFETALMNRVPTDGKGNSIFDPHTGYRYRPLLEVDKTSDPDLPIWYTTNSHGHIARGEYPIKKPKDTFRVGIIGDSFAANVTNTVRWGDILEDQLNASSKWRQRVDNNFTQVINFGLDGIGTVQFGAVAEHLVRPFQIDLLIVNVIRPDVLRRAYYRGFRPAAGISDIKKLVDERVLSRLPWFDFYPNSLATILKKKTRISMEKAQHLFWGERHYSQKNACVPPRGVRSAHGGVGHRERSDRSPRSPWVSLNEAAIACLR